MPLAWSTQKWVLNRPAQAPLPVARLDLAALGKLTFADPDPARYPALDLARRGTLDAVSSDYAPAALLHAAMLLAEKVEGISLPQAMATVTSTPARAAGLEDRGELREGLRADLIRIRDARHPILRGVWRAGERIA